MQVNNISFPYIYAPDFNKIDRSKEFTSTHISSKTSIKQQKINQIINELKTIERKVIAHELAHKTVGGELAGSVHYQYVKGPDGKMYIVGGEVPIYFKEGKTAEETIKIAEKIRAAALAPADPSPQDLKVAAKATMLEIKARMELSSEKNFNQKKNKISIRV
ncbi:putative metalloprotease CJM1_0395 family protein [Hydrogenothermus marinus]|uniref:SprA family protein n=1 Tax=Hydrogenothermus marinus TaxID=133270 RepID=A0A3M0B919_9AQUI|nr:putative metalloprotease CJM1_0395 family protein [Hydrogenothermus marinus]RMA93066.1 SprA family protein [Hydrogenothermus marinus]